MQLAAGVGHPVIEAAGPDPSIPVDPFAPAVGEKSSAGLGAYRDDQIKIPASGGSTVQLRLLRGPAAPVAPLLLLMAAAA